MSAAAVAAATCARPAGLADEEAMFLDVVGELTDAEIEPRAAAADARAVLPGELTRLLAEQELDLVAAPESWGGAGGRPLLALLAVERIAESSGALACLLGHRQAALAAGAPRGAVLVDGTGTVRADAGTLRGRVEQAPAVAPERALAIVARGGDGELVALAVDPGAAAVGPVLERTGLRGLPTAPLELDGVEGAPLGPAMEARAHRLRSLGAAASGVARRAVVEARAYLLERNQFGGPIARFGALRAMLDAAAADAAGAAALVHDGGGDPARSARAAAAAAVRAADCAVQLHGGYGYVSDHPAERLLRDAISLRALAAGPRAGAAADDLLGGDEEEGR